MNRRPGSSLAPIVGRYTAPPRFARISRGFRVPTPRQLDACVGYSALAVVVALIVATLYSWMV